LHGQFAPGKEQDAIIRFLYGADLEITTSLSGGMEIEQANRTILIGQPLERIERQVEHGELVLRSNCRDHGKCRLVYMQFASACALTCRQRHKGGGFSWQTGLDSSGWLYVPNSCTKGEPCRLHIALHGCKQGQSYLPLKPPPGGGTTFVKNTGYERWADNNHLVILYPQAVSIPLLNPNGCWDWWGYSGADYATKNGVQIQALKAMVDQLGSGRHQ